MRTFDVICVDVLKCANKEYECSYKNAKNGISFHPLKNFHQSVPLNIAKLLITHHHTYIKIIRKSTELKLLNNSNSSNKSRLLLTRMRTTSMRPTSKNPRRTRTSQRSPTKQSSRARNNLPRMTRN